MHSTSSWSQFRSSASRLPGMQFRYGGYRGSYGSGYSSSHSSGGGSSYSGSGRSSGASSSRPRWSRAGSSVSYTPAQVVSPLHRFARL